jgi:hypothetical protein
MSECVSSIGNGVGGLGYSYFTDTELSWPTREQYRMGAVVKGLAFHASGGSDSSPVEVSRGLYKYEHPKRRFIYLVLLIHVSTLSIHIMAILWVWQHLNYDFYYTSLFRMGSIAYPDPLLWGHCRVQFFASVYFFAYVPVYSGQPWYLTGCLLYKMLVECCNRLPPRFGGLPLKIIGGG